jgi:hypothetical protein
MLDVDIVLHPLGQGAPLAQCSRKDFAPDQSKFDLVIDLRIAQELKIEIPQSFCSAPTR